MARRQKTSSKSTLREIFAANLRAERARRALTQEQLAELTGLHHTYISRLEAAGYNLGIDTLECVAKALQVEPQALISKQ